MANKAWKIRKHRDEIHGDVTLDPIAEALLNTAPLQRLGRVYQLGYAHLVYRGATYTRLSHAMSATTRAENGEVILSARLTRLERLAIMIAIDAPEQWSRLGYTTRVARAFVNEIRDAMTERGIDWRAAIAESKRRRAERGSEK